MVLLNRVRNVLGLESQSPSTARWPAGLLTLFVPLAIWAATAGAPSEQRQAVADHATVEKVMAKEIHKLEHDTARDQGVLSVAWSRDGDMLASTTHEVYLWSRFGGTLKRFSNEKDRIPINKNGVAFSPDGKTLATSGARMKYPTFASPYASQSTIFDLDGTVQKTLDGNTDYPMYGAAFSPDGSLLAGGTGIYKTREIKGETIGYIAGGKVLIWNLVDRTTLELDDGATTDWVRAVAFSPDGKILATGSNGVTFWDPQSGVSKGKLATKKPASVAGLAFSHDGKMLAVSQNINMVHLYDVKSRKLVRTLQDGSRLIAGSYRFAKGLSFSPDGKLLATGGWVGTTRQRDAELKLWDVATGKVVQDLKGHTAAVNGVAFSPDGKLLATASDDKTVRIWEIIRKKQ